MKNLSDYLQGKQCGLKFKAMYLDGESMPSSPPMALGNWFEYVATGQLPRNGEVPEPKRLKSGKLSTDYVRAETQTHNYKALIEHHGFEVINTGYAFHKNNIATGISDVMARKDGKLCVIDLKMSGLLDDKWNELGWSLETIEQKDKILVQAVHYTILAEDEFEEEVDFYFAVFSSKNETDYLLLKVNLDPDTIERHKEDVILTKEVLESEIKKGFKANPSYRLCNKCFLKDSYTEAQLTAEITNIYY